MVYNLTMSLNISPKVPAFDPKFNGSEGAEAMAVILELNKKKFKVRRSKIRDLAGGLAEIAYDLGETNDPESYADEMTEVIFRAYKKVSEKQRRRN